MKTTPRQIVEYWGAREDECSFSVDWAEAQERCWRCGYRRSLQRCHIVPDSLGGQDSPENLVLLCLQCHREAPNVADPAFFWKWLHAHATPLYDTYWTLWAIDEFARIYGRQPFATLPNPDAAAAAVPRVLRDYIQKVSTHWGEAGLNSSSLAWVLHELESQLLRGDA